MSLILVRRLGGLAAALALALVFFFGREARAFERRFVIEKRPAWVDAHAPDLDFDSSGARFGALKLLEDRQRRFTRTTTTVYVHDATKITSASGVEGQSELRVDFDPSYESLRLHAVRVVRGGRALDVLRAEDVKILQREASLSEGVYTGALTALLFLPDVRVGDVVEYEYSIVGRNPAAGEHVDLAFDLARRLPIHALRHRILVPSNEHVDVKEHSGAAPPRVSSRGAEIEYAWERNDVPALVYERDVPDWYDEAPWVQLTDFRSWGDVAEWATSLFEEQKKPSADFASLVARIAREPTDEKRILAALRFVQSEVRYLGIELGKGGWVPHAPSEVLATRYGDCKDKAFLLVALLRALGIDAAPALVSTTTRRGLDAMLPSAWSFNHAIARVRAGGRTYWLDGTETFAGGPLDERTPDVERALVAAPGEVALAVVPTVDARTPSVAVVETFDAGGEGASPLHVRTTYRRRAADAMRRSVASTPREELAKRRLDARAADFAAIATDGPMRIVDDEASNVLTIEEEFRIPDLWRDGSRTFTAPTLGAYLDVPEQTDRRAPLGVDFPLNVEVTSTIIAPVDAADDVLHVASDALMLDYVAKHKRDRVERTFHLRALRDAIPAKDYAAHADAVRRMRQTLGVELARTGRANAPALNAWILVGPLTVIILGALVSGTLWLALRAGGAGATRLEAFRERATLRAGDAPSTAIAFATREACEGWLASVACGCGRRAGAVHRGELRYGDAIVSAAAVRCACGRDERRYFRVGS